ncbi:class II fructose-bisphosphate aldolase [Cohnella thailandensis]|nr:class II fructose-bisphosphate aldolase [Cohnella thailandensis]MBP1971869.1 tagatose 1,6-diphosphate aldolase GatY/KbaY [Cohnella thailandensis]
MLLSSTEMLQKAKAQNYCISAFNVYTFEMLQGVIEAAQELRAPVIIQTSVGTVKQLGANYIVAHVRAAAEVNELPIALHLDHCSDFTIISDCIRAGYTSVMIDASHFSLEENISRTKQVVNFAQKYKVHVEAELGKIVGTEDNIIVSEKEMRLADPDECLEFVEATRVDSLAPAVGTAHGIYKQEPNIDFERIERIASMVSIPLVLHGGSGIPEAQVKRAISLGMSKMNIATEIRNVYSEALRNYFRQYEAENDPRRYLVPAREALKSKVKESIRMCGCDGKY